MTHFHAYVRQGDGTSVNYRACCSQTWANAVQALREMGYSNVASVPAEPAPHWQSVTSGGRYPKAAIQRASGDYDTCNGD